MFFLGEDALALTCENTLKISSHFANVEEFPIQRKIDNKMKEKINKYLKKRKKDK
jgi:hypothetical protein